MKNNEIKKKTWVNKLRVKSGAWEQAVKWALEGKKVLYVTSGGDVIVTTEALLTEMVEGEIADAVKETAEEIKLMISVLSHDKNITSPIVEEIERVYLKEQNI